VDVLSRAESVHLLERRIPDLDAEVADQLTDELGDLPLAIAQAAGYIDTNNTPPERYLQLFRTKRDQLLAKGHVPDHVLLDATWTLSLIRLAEQDPAAVQLLQLAAFLAPEPFPVALLQADPGLLPEPFAAAVTDDLAREEALGTIHAYALARRTPDAMQLHRLIQAVIRWSLPTEKREALLTTVLGLLRAALPADIRYQPTAWPRWRALLPHVLAALTTDAEQIDPDTAAWLLDRAGTYLQSRGEPTSARPLFERALSIAEAAYGPDHPTVATALNNLALVLRDLGEPASARPLGERALGIAEAAYGPDHPEVATALNNLALVLRDLGEPAAARPLAERALRIAEAAYGPDHPTVATRLSNLATVLRELGEPASARPLAKRRPRR
jgi:tetratricopeptide (TPR) repeat protein